jgi:hypothetical protein
MSIAVNGTTIAASQSSSRLSVTPMQAVHSVPSNA